MNIEDIEENIANEPSAMYGQHYTYTDYLTFGDEVIEIIKGKIFKMSPVPKLQHQKVSGKIYTLISNFLRWRKCQVIAAPFDVILPVKGKDFSSSDRVVQPDIAVVCDEYKLQEAGCFGAPDLIIEILSPSTLKHDYQTKFDLYEESGVKEYWIVDPENNTIEVFVLENEKYKRVSTYVNDDLVPSDTLLGLEIDLRDVFG